jgi:putative transposase
MHGQDNHVLRQERPDLARRYWKGVPRLPSYFAASCGGASSNVLKSYIEQQKKPR